MLQHGLPRYTGRRSSITTGAAVGAKPTSRTRKERRTHPARQESRPAAAGGGKRRIKWSVLVAASRPVPVTVFPALIGEAWGPLRRSASGGRLGNSCWPDFAIRHEPLPPPQSPTETQLWTLTRSATICTC